MVDLETGEETEIVEEQVVIDLTDARPTRKAAKKAYVNIGNAVSIEKKGERQDEGMDDVTFYKKMPKYKKEVNAIIEKMTNEVVQDLIAELATTSVNAFEYPPAPSDFDDFTDSEISYRDHNNVWPVIDSSDSE